MKRLFVVLFLISVLVMPLPSIQAQRRKRPAATPAAVTPKNGVEQITAAQMQAFLTFISADEMEGRDTPSRGLDTVAKFIAMNLTRWGFKPAGDDGTFFQRISLRSDRIDAAQTRVELDGKALVPGEDYIPTSAAGDVNGQLVFAGNGWFIKSRGIDAYKEIDAKGKIAVIFTSPFGLPRGSRRTDLEGKQGVDWMSPLDYARKQGVAGLIYVPDSQFLASWDRTRQRIMERSGTVVEKFQTQGSTVIPTIIASA